MLAGLLVGCGRAGAALMDVFPTGEAVPGWQPSGEVRRYDGETLYQLVDGQADAYFAYGFEAVVVQSYAGAAGAIVDVEVWQVATSADAYGLFTAYRAGEPAQVDGAGDADADPGRRLAFWQGRAYVRIRAREDVPDADLQAFAAALSAALPAGGRRPALLDRLPQEGLVVESVIYFHQEQSIQDRLWLGGTNVLGLDARCEGVLAQVRLDEAAGDTPTMMLLLVQYPDEKAAATGLAALQAGQIDGVAAAQARGRLLAAAFGDVDPGVAGEWLEGMLAGSD